MDKKKEKIRSEIKVLSGSSIDELSVPVSSPTVPQISITTKPLVLAILYYWNKQFVQKGSSAYYNQQCKQLVILGYTCVRILACLQHRENLPPFQRVLEVM